MTPQPELKDLAIQLLQKERHQGSVQVNELTNVLQFGPERNARRKELIQLVASDPILSDRDMIQRNHVERYTFGAKKAVRFIKFAEEQRLSPDDIQMAYRVLGEPLCIDVHRSMFIPTLLNQATEEQQKKWVPLAKAYRVIGAYAQTELGHGSNVQALETTATYDPHSDEIVLNSPTLTSRKWWPGGLGKTANHAIVHARLYVHGKNCGIQAFLVQLRSVNDHQPLDGIELGDIGPKVGFNAIDNGFLALHHVRIPRENMLMRFSKLSREGVFTKPVSDKLVYFTMIEVRASLIDSSARSMAFATVITTRFSACRIQGNNLKSPKGENQVLDYQNQQRKLFPLIGLSYAAFFAGKTISSMLQEVSAQLGSGKGFQNQLKLLHATSSGLKALLTSQVSDGIEHCRRLCGGHGYSETSSLSHMFKEFVGSCTYEGAFDVLILQHSRFLVNNFRRVTKGYPISGNATAILGFLNKANELVNPTKRCSAMNASDFYSFTVLVDAFETRAARLLTKAAHTLAQHNGNVNACMIELTQASIAHSQLVLVTFFATSVSRMTDGPNKSALSSLCCLYGLTMMHDYLGEFREKDFLSSTQAEKISVAIKELLLEVRKNAVLLTDAWDITDFELNSTIGRYDGDMYRALVKRAAQEPLNQSEVADAYYSDLQTLIKSGLHSKL